MQQQVKPTISKIWATPDPRRIVAIAARMTYSNIPIDQLTDKLGEEEISKSVNAVLERRHTSVLRHAVYCFAIKGVSRAFSHQLVRHTVGHAYEQRSQHYRKEKEFNFVLPGTVVESGMVEDYIAAMSMTNVIYEDLMAAGVPREDARQVLPNACETMLIWTANLEAMMNFIKARACRANCDEIMDIAAQARKLIIEDFPEMKKYLGPTCWTTGICYEGDKYYKECNKPWKTPCVLWRPDFPATIEVIGIGDLHPDDVTIVTGKK